MAQARARPKPGADRFFEPAVELLRTVASDLAGEPGLWYGRAHVVYESETESGVRTLGQNDALTQAREPDFWDLLLYHRALISMLTKPGTRSSKLAYDIGRAALRGYASKETVPLDDMVTAVLGSFAARTRPVETGRFPPEGDDMITIVRHALGYSIGAMRRRARDYVRELRAGGDVDPDTLGAVEDDARAGSLRGEPTCFGAGGIAFWSIAAVARDLERPRATIRNVASRLELADRRTPRNVRLFTKAEVQEIDRHLPPRRKFPVSPTPPKKRVRVRRQPYPKGTQFFGGDFKVGDDGEA